MRWRAGNKRGTPFDHRRCQLASTGPGGLRPWDTDTEKKGGSVASRVAHDPCNLTIASYYHSIIGHLVLKGYLIFFFSRCQSFYLKGWSEID